MQLPRTVQLGVLGKVVGALCAVLIALTGLAGIAVRATGEATRGADRVGSELNERVITGAALTAALDNFALTQERWASDERSAGPPPGPGAHGERRRARSATRRIGR